VLRGPRRPIGEQGFGGKSPLFLERCSPTTHAPAAAAEDRGRRSWMLKTSPRDQAEWLCVCTNGQQLTYDRIKLLCVWTILIALVILNVDLLISY